MHALAPLFFTLNTTAVAKPITRKQREYKTLISVLSHGATAEVRALLIAETGEDAANRSDLEYKLAQLYYNSTAKIDLERKLAGIHPHRDFILKYQPKPEPVVTEKKFLQGSIPLANEYLKPIDHAEIVINEDLSKKTEGKSCGCGCSKKNDYSSIDGMSVLKNININWTAVIIAGMVSTVAIAGAVLYFKHKK